MSFGCLFGISCLMHRENSCQQGAVTIVSILAVLTFPSWLVLRNIFISYVMAVKKFQQWKEKMF